MRIANILSERFVEDWPSYHIIYEWEDVLADRLAVPISNTQPLWRKLFINRYTKKLADSIGSQAFSYLNEQVEYYGRVGKRTHYLVFELYVTTEPSFSTSTRAIPVMIDFWKQTDLSAFYQQYKHCSLVLISSLEVLHYLQAQQCPLPIAHFPLSLADKYRPAAGTIYEKTYDVLFAGRANPVLLSYMQEFLVRFPDTEVLQQESHNGELHYVSNKRGVIGNFHSRAEYMNLLRASKVSFYSTPGIDGGEVRTGGFNPVTPRFLELLSAQCLLLGRYPVNAETQFYELEKVCPNINSYTEFEAILLSCLEQKSPSFAQHEAILAKHYTSCRAELLPKLLA
jgi:hypothetical protein